MKIINLLFIMLPLVSFFSHSSDDPNFTFDTAKDNLGYVSESLSSFRELTAISSKADVDKVGNTSWDIQQIGFENWVRNIEGTLLLQELQISELSLKLIDKNHADYDKAKEKVDKAKREFGFFKEKFVVYD